MRPPRRRRRSLSQTAPAPQHPGKGIFGDAIEYLGYDTDPVQPRAGRPVAITYYFHALKDVSHDWKIFVHVDGRGGQSRINGDHYPAGGALHTDQWKAGQYVADRFVVDLPDANGQGARPTSGAGFYQDDARLPITNPKECVNDGNNRLLAGTLLDIRVRSRPAVPVGAGRGEHASGGSVAVRGKSEHHGQGAG